ncbi:WD repeat-containing protein 87 [Borealophlyctis nickersoniae]|nr:WD repeat-containing protein 87 [Borealophlyctis nickersoniae]
MAFNSQTEVLAVTTGEARGLHIWKIGERGVVGPVKKHGRDDDHSINVTSVACCEELRLFASAGSDGMVKIWDEEGNTLVREMQFNEPLGSVCFANHRGDLLIGMTDQVALIRVQDYLPAAYLRPLLETRTAWIDDPIEAPTMFDSNLDFWQLYREEAEEKSGMRWHLTNAQPPQMEVEESSRALLQVERKYDEAMRERKRHLHEQYEAEARERANREAGRYELITTVPADWRAASRGGTEAGDDIPHSADGMFHGPGGMDMEEMHAEDDFDAAWAEQHAVRLEADPVLLAAEAAEMDARRQMYRAKLTPRNKGRTPSRVLEEGVEENGRLVGDNESLLMPPSRGRAVTLGHARRSSTSDSGTATPMMLSQRRRSVSMPASEIRVPSFRIQEPAYPARQELVALKPKQQLILERPERLKMTGQEIQANMDRDRLAAVTRPLDNGKESGGGNTATRRNWIRARMERMGMLPNSVVASEVGAGLERKRVEEEKKRRKRDEEKRMEEMMVIEKAKKFLEKRRAAGVGGGGTGRAAALRPGAEVETAEEGKPEVKGEGWAEDYRDLTPEEKAELAAKRMALEALVKAESAAKAEAALQAAKAKAEGEAKVRAQIAAQEAAEAEAVVEAGAARKAMEIMARAGEILKSREGRTPVASERVEESQAATMTPADERSAEEEFVGATVVTQSTRTGVPMTNFGPANAMVVDITRGPSIKPSPAGMPPKRPLGPPPDRATLPELREAAGAARPHARHRLRKGSTQLPDGGRRSIGRPGQTVTLPPIPRSPPTPPHRRAVARSAAGMDDTYRALMPDLPAEDEQAKISWGLFQQAFAQRDEIGRPFVATQMEREDQLQSELAGVMRNFWFPGLGGMEVTLQNIVKVLLRLLKTGYWSEKCEASKSLLYLYRTFQRDFRDPLECLVLPQIESLTDENWQVRAAACNNLVGYGLYDMEIVYGLVCRLVDPNDEVRAAAMKGLAVCGITSKTSLRGILMQLRMIPPDFTAPQSDWLDVSTLPACLMIKKE